MQDFLKNILTDIKVDVLKMIRKNFENKSFFDRNWPVTKIPNKRGSLMIRSGKLSNSFTAQIFADAVKFSSSMPYARIQNEGGIIVVTRKMQKYFWAMYYSLAGKTTYSVKTKNVANTKKNKALIAEAQYWRAMALKKVGSKITIRSRRFIGHHLQVDVLVKNVCDDKFNDLNEYIKNKFISKK